MSVKGDSAGLFFQWHGSFFWLVGQNKDIEFATSKVMVVNLGMRRQIPRRGGPQGQQAHTTPRARTKSENGSRMA
jgi:hypothetical protein